MPTILKTVHFALLFLLLQACRETLDSDQLIINAMSKAQLAPHCYDIKHDSNVPPMFEDYIARKKDSELCQSETYQEAPKKIMLRLNMASSRVSSFNNKTKAWENF